MMPPARKAQREGHVEHRPLAGRDPRLDQRLNVVRYRLDARVGTAAQGIGAEEKKRDGEDPTHLLRQLAGFPATVSGISAGPGFPACRRNTVEDEHHMGDEETREKDRQAGL